VRRWHRRGLIVPRREVRRLPYFDFQEIATARRLAELLAAGMSPQAIERKLALLARYMPGVERPLAQLSVIVEGKQLLLRQGDGLIAPGGQHWFNFAPQAGEQPADRAGQGITAEKLETDSPLAGDDHQPAVALPLRRNETATPAEMLHEAARLEDEGRLAAAAEMYRAVSMSGGPSAEVCFALAELLYRAGDVAAARERYYMAIELDEEYVEARANLGCVLAELGERELAVAAFEGALAFHDEYADVHYHLARTLDELDRTVEAAEHWEAFLRLAPESPWAETARRRLAES
jgi:tetratricopeptide (TPR) repeat protein